MKVIKHKDKWYLQSETGYKQIILTTDQDLIKDGIQAIDDDFLEWFVKNPSCEEVETKLVNFEVDMGLGESCIEYGSYYKIIIPKEEPKQDFPKFGTKEFNDLCYKFMGGKPKQETLEEVARKEYQDTETAFLRGAKWQKEQYKDKFSEEDMLNFAQKYAVNTLDKSHIEQFKKK